jgi:hypothetical protein
LCVAIDGSCNIDDLRSASKVFKVVSRRLPITRALIVAFCALTTVLSLVVVRAVPAAASRGHDAITTLRGGELTPADRSSRGVDRARAHRVREDSGASPPSTTDVTLASGNALTSIAPLALADTLPPFTWMPWQSPTRARADLMVFLN